MADNFIRHQRWEDGALVDEWTEPKPLEQYNRETLIERAQAAVASNADYLALASPTNAEALEQIRKMTRQMNAVIRLLVIHALDDINDA